MLPASHKAVGAVVAASRRDADLSQEEIAEELGISRNTVVALENGRTPSDDNPRASEVFEARKTFARDTYRPVCQMASLI